MNRNSSSFDAGKSRRKRAEKRAGKRGRPLDETMLRDLALAYVARFATTGAKLEAYLARKIRERGVAEDSDGRTRELDVAGIVKRLIELGYVDDDAYARMRTRDLTQRGYGARRVEQALWAAGVDEDVRVENAPSEAQSREAAVLFARKRRFGVFGRAFDENGDEIALDPAKREKQIAALLRAGHHFEHVRLIFEAETETFLNDWVAEASLDE